MSNMSDWARHGNWDVNLEREAFRIFPKAPDGTTMPVMVKRVYINLKRDYPNGTHAELKFKHFLHQRKLYWSDLRQKGSVHRNQIRDELARLLFNGDKVAAAAMIQQAEDLL